MRPHLTLTTIAAMAAALAGPALAQDAASHAEIDQVQLDDVWSNMLVEIPGDTWEVTSASTAIGNAAASQVTGGSVYSDVIQTLGANVSAGNAVHGGSTDFAVVTTTAFGNTATGSTWEGALGATTDQLAYGDISANTVVELDYAHSISSATTALANVATTSNEFGDHDSRQLQYNNGSVDAATRAVLCCTGDTASFVTTAGGNAVSSTGSTSTSIHQAEQFIANGTSIRATTEVDGGDSGEVIAATAAFGNSNTVYNEWGYVTLGQKGAPVRQDNGADINSVSAITLDNVWGYASASAYGVGNTASVSNFASDTGLYVDQANYGAISASAGLNGTGGADASGIVTATAIGNAASATLCNTCGDAAIYGSAAQYNSGTVIAQGRATDGQSGRVHGSATAVGNSSTYQSNGH